MRVSQLARRLEGTPRVVEAAALLAATRVVLAASPAAAAAKMLKRARDSAGVAPHSRLGTAQDVARAVERAAPWVGGTCLNRALTGWLMLRYRGIGAVVKVGAQRSERGAVRMHAWLELDGTALIGNAESEAFVPLTRPR